GDEEAFGAAALVVEGKDRAILPVAADGDAVDGEREALAEFEASACELDGVARARLDQRRLQLLLSVRPRPDSPCARVGDSGDEKQRKRDGDDPHDQLPTS